MKTRMVKCACGVEFETDGPNVKRCPECRKLFMLIYGKWYRRVGSSELARKSATDEYLSIIGNPAKVEERRNVKVVHRCRYCGKRLTGNEWYCKRCVAYGLDLLNKYNGKTNGWDKKGTGDES